MMPYHSTSSQPDTLKVDAARLRSLRHSEVPGLRSLSVRGPQHEVQQVVDDLQYRHGISLQPRRIDLQSKTRPLPSPSSSCFPMFWAAANRSAALASSLRPCSPRPLLPEPPPSQPHPSEHSLPTKKEPSILAQALLRTAAVTAIHHNPPSMAPVLLEPTPTSPARKTSTDRPGKTIWKGRKTRVPFRVQEDRALREGIRLCGKGKWQAILEQFSVFQGSHRTAVNLKDRARTLGLC